MRRLAETVKKDAKYAHEKSEFIRDLKTDKHLGGAREEMVRLKERPKVGRKMVKIGTAMVLAPEPFGDIPGGILIAGGLAFTKYRDPISIADIKPNLKKLFRDFESTTI
jgi:hypothetical protein